MELAINLFLTLIPSIDIETSSQFYDLFHWVENLSIRVGKRFIIV